jgi:hypothetical protein
MVIILQLLIFCIAFAFRGRFFLGSHLKLLPNSADLTYIGRSKNGIISRHVGVTQQCGIPFIIKRERWYHSFLKRMGIAAEISVGSEAFDTKYFITTDHPSHLERALATSAMIADLQELFALPIKSVHATQSKIWCVCKRGDLEESESHYYRHRALLGAISKRTQQSTTGDDFLLPQRNLGRFAFLFLAAHAGLITLGIFGALPTLADSIDTLDNHLLVIKGMLAGLVLSGLWLFLIVSIFNRSSWVCWVLVDFLICGLIGFVLSGIFIVREANVHLPQPAATIMVTPVTQKICTLNCSQRCGRRCTRRSSYTFYDNSGCNPQSRAESMILKKQTDSICRSSAYYSYQITTKPWRPGKHYSFSPNITLFDGVNVGTDVSIPVNPGALRLEWVDTDAISPTH